MDFLLIGALWRVAFLAAHQSDRPDGILLTFLDAVAVVIAPWLVHVLALAALFHLPLPRPIFDKTLLYALLASLLIPTLGMALFLIPMALALPLLHLAAHLSGLLPWLGRVVEIAFGAIVVPAIAAAVGAVLGLTLASFRGLGFESQPLCVARRSDVIGGMLGGFVLLALLGLSQAMRSRLGVAFVPAALNLLAAVLALLPHLVLTGRDLLRLNPPPATSASGAARSAPCR